MIALPPVTYDEYRHLMRLLGAPGDIGPRSLGVGLTAEGVIALRARFEGASSCCGGGTQWGHEWSCPTLP